MSSFSFGGNNNTGSGIGGPSNSNSNAVTGGFSFGSTPSTSTAAPSLGATNTPASSSSPMFAFNPSGGTTSNQTSSAASSNNPPSFGGLSFGGGGETAATSANPSSNLFGNASAPTTTTNLNNDTKPSFSFGSSGTPSFGGITAVSGVSQSSAPSFGAPATTTATTTGDSKPSFSFGGPPPSSSLTGGFSFGNTSTTNVNTNSSNTNAPATSSIATSGTSTNTPAPAMFGNTNFGFSSGPVVANESKATGGFSFGSSNNATPGTSNGDEKPTPQAGSAQQGAPTPIPTFGSTNETKATTTPTPAGATTNTGFSFGVATPTQLKTPTVGDTNTPGPPDPVATPGAPTPGPADAATTTPAASTADSAATAAPPTSTTNVSTTKPPQEPIRLEYQTLTVEQILNTFQQEIEKDAVIYLEEARRVAEYDAILRDSQRDLNMLTENVRRCLIEQKEVEQTLVGIGAFQSELDRTLDTVERNVDELFGAQSHLVPVDADQEREAAYKMAHDVDVRLQELQTTIQSTMRQMEMAEDRALTGDIAKIVHVLNQHQRSLASLEDVARRMEVDIANVNRVLTQR